MPRRWGFNPFFIRASVYCHSPRGGDRQGPVLFQSLLHQGISLLDDVSSPASWSRYRFNPFFIRASVYWPHSASVSAWGLGCSFNPFFIRASVYCPARPVLRRRGLGAFQSLLHQGISLLGSSARPCCIATRAVSIPSSSGHQFTGWQAGFGQDALWGRFNPFFIRASVYWAAHAGSDGACRRRFNPFFIRASVYCHPEIRAARESIAPVSIPSSSGHQFTVGLRTISPVTHPPSFQSLLHQGISLLNGEISYQLLPLFKFQSLLHQGISLLALGRS